MESQLILNTMGSSSTCVDKHIYNFLGIKFLFMKQPRYIYDSVFIID